jgi:hypothetical protein
LRPRTNGTGLVPSHGTLLIRCLCTDSDDCASWLFPHLGSVPCFHNDSVFLGGFCQSDVVVFFFLFSAVPVDDKHRTSTVPRLGIFRCSCLQTNEPFHFLSIYRATRGRRACVRAPAHRHLRSPNSLSPGVCQKGNLVKLGASHREEEVHF